MTITEFAEERNIKSQTVSIYISRHKEIFDGHTKKKGKTIELDEVAIKVLDEKYPYPKPVEVVDGISFDEYNRVRTKLEHAQDMIVELQQKYQENQIKYREAELEASAFKTFLEDKEQQLEEKNLQLDDTKRQLDQSQAELGKFRKSIFGFYKKDE